MSNGHNEGVEQLTVEMAEYMRDRFFGKYRATVTNVDDPEEMGRMEIEAFGTYPLCAL